MLPSSKRRTSAPPEYSICNNTYIYMLHFSKLWGFVCLLVNILCIFLSLEAVVFVCLKRAFGCVGRVG